MLKDSYGNKLGTGSQSARDSYIDGVEGFLSARPGAENAFRDAAQADETFALAHVGIARCRLLMGDGVGAKEAMALARTGLPGLSEREAAHVDAIGKIVDGDGPGAYKAIRAHVMEYPRDVMIAQTCTSVFGMIGFSGREGREAEQLAYTTMLAPAYGDDWWFLGMHAFAQGEVGQLDLASDTIEHALEGNPRSAHNAHVSAHIFYEAGHNGAGYRFLKDWWTGYQKGGAIHGHISWHVALWALANGDPETAWQIVDDHCKPGGSEGPPLNILTDTVSILHRAALAGIPIAPERWQEISAYAAAKFPKSGLAFADIHAALAHCMAGNDDAYETLTRQAAGPAADIVSTVWDGFHAFAAEDWDAVEVHLGAAMYTHERLGGSRAQRDLLEFSLAHAMQRRGKQQNAARLIAMRRPRQTELANI